MQHRMSRRRDRGSTLLLFPAGVLIVMMLSAIAVDLSMIHSGQRDLQRVVHSAADDAASDIDIDLLRRTGQISIDLEAARRSVTNRLRTVPAAVDSVTSIRVDAGPRPNTLRVTVVATIRHVFGRAVPGVPETETVRTTVVSEISPSL